jgi:hypothetical protein
MTEPQIRFDDGAAYERIRAFGANPRASNFSIGLPPPLVSAGLMSDAATELSRN